MAASKWAALGLVAASVSGCVSSQYGAAPPAAPAATPVAARGTPSFPVERLVGSWGVASYRADADRARTQAMARLHCRNPYVIAKGPTDGVMMHVADNPRPFELTLKASADGKTYLGFNAPPGHAQDREILSSTENEIVMRFVNPTIHERYGTFIYVRCPS